METEFSWLYKTWLFMVFDKNKIKHKFDQSYGKFHFYDHGFCTPNYIDGVLKTLN
jgi:hypothetical protein